MHLQKRTRNKDGKNYEYWELVESYRTARGPRRRSVAYLGVVGPGERLGVKLAAEEKTCNAQGSLFDNAEPEWVEVDTKRVRVERTRQFGGAWLGLELTKMLELPEFLQDVMSRGLEDIPWWAMSLILVLCRLCDPSSELRISEHIYERSALPDILGVPVEKVNDDRLYRSLDRLLIHKPELERYLANRLGELFGLEYDLLLYDVTSTYFEGECAKRQEKEKAMHERFERRIEEGLAKMEQTCKKKRYKPTLIAQRIGRLLEKNSRAAGLFKVDVQTDHDGAAKLVWSKVDAWRDWAALSEGCYILRSNVNDWSAEDLWKAYIQLTGIDIRRRCVARPTKHQAILLQHLRLSLPTHLKVAEM